MNGTSNCSWKRLEIRAEELFRDVTERIDRLDMLFSVESRSQGTDRVPHPRISQLSAGAGANDAKPARQCRSCSFPRPAGCCRLEIFGRKGNQCSSVSAELDNRADDQSSVRPCIKHVTK